MKFILKLQDQSAHFKNNELPVSITIEVFFVNITIEV